MDQLAWVANRRQISMTDVLIAAVEHEAKKIGAYSTSCMIGSRQMR